MYTDRRLQLIKSSAPLVRLNAEGHPSSIASGMLVDYCGHRLLLTVEHAIGDFKRWAIQLHSTESAETKLHALGTMNFLKEVSLESGKTEKIDFAYKSIPKNIDVYRQEVTDKLKVEASYPITIFELDFEHEPNKDQVYGFAGLVKGQLEKHPDLTIFATDLKIYDELRYLRFDGKQHVFKLPYEHPGDVEFEGCSGAPIIGSDGIPIALLTSGCKAKNEIYGITAVPLTFIEAQTDQGCVVFVQAGHLLVMPLSHAFRINSSVIA